MKLLVSIISFICILVCGVLFHYNIPICKHYYSDINEIDTMRHGVYGWIVLLFYVGLKLKNENFISKITTVFVYSFVWGMLIPNIVDRWRSEYGFYKRDVVFYILALYGGMKDLFPLTHKKIGLLFLRSEKIYNLLCQKTMYKH